MCGNKKRFDHFEGKSTVCKICIKNTIGTSKLTAKSLDAMMFTINSKSEVKPSDSISQIGVKRTHSKAVTEFNIGNDGDNDDNDAMHIDNEDEEEHSHLSMIKEQQPYKRQLLDHAINNTSVVAATITSPSVVTVQSTPSVIFVAHTD
jgi:hypothetical protein